MICREDFLASFTEELLYECTWHPFMFLHFDYYLPIPHSHYVVGGAHHLEKVNVMWDHLLQPLVTVGHPNNSEAIQRSHDIMAFFLEYYR